MSRTAQSTPRDAETPTTHETTPEAGFRVKWDRTALAALALVAALTFIGTGVAAAFGAGTLVIAGVSAVVAVVAVASLRALAVRDRKKRADRRIEHAFDEAMSPTVASADPVVSGAGTTPVFDAASGSGTSDRTPAPSDRPAAPASERQDAGPAESAAPEAAALPSVPRPTYLDAGEAHRPAPAPLVTPEAPMASPGVKLKSGVSAEYRARLEATAHRPLDLDRVLERRRAV
ncbi:hypothetical protein AB0K08_11105 [Citricoccus sp. NPDC055426]|uniref:hypothetical protein n=1 Tax=Citricoccus sp. NPDC055426 TaxID=3155536 RepID=UPI003432497F